MSFNPYQTNNGQEVIFLRKTNKVIHPPFYFNKASVKHAHTQKKLDLLLDTKLSLNERTNNKATKDTARKIIFSIFSARKNMVYLYLFSIQEKMIFS